MKTTIKNETSCSQSEIINNGESKMKNQVTKEKNMKIEFKTITPEQAKLILKDQNIPIKGCIPQYIHHYMDFIRSNMAIGENTKLFMTSDDPRIENHILLAIYKAHKTSTLAIVSNIPSDKYLVINPFKTGIDAYELYPREEHNFAAKVSNELYEYLDYSDIPRNKAGYRYSDFCAIQVYKHIDTVSKNVFPLKPESFAAIWALVLAAEGDASIFNELFKQKPDYQKVKQYYLESKASMNENNSDPGSISFVARLLKIRYGI